MPELDHHAKHDRPMASPPSTAYARQAVQAALCAALAGGVIVLGFGLSQAAIGWQRESGFRALDPLRVLAAAGLGGAPAVLFAALGAAYLRRLDERALLSRFLFWSAPVCATAVAAVLVYMPAAAEATVVPPWLVPIGCALLVVVGWRGRFFWRAPAASTPAGWLIIAAAFLLMTLDRSPTTMELKGPLAFVLVGVMLAVALLALGMMENGLRRWNQRASLALLGCVAATTAACVWLPWIIVDLYSYAKLMVVFGCAMGVGHLVAMWALEGSGGPRRSMAWAGACLLVVGLLASGWLGSRPVPERFGSLERNSLVGLFWVVGSAHQDADSDGHYARSAGGNDPDDHRADIGPPDLAVISERRPELPEGGAPEPTLDEPLEHVVIIIVDSLRADLLNDAAKRRDFPFFDRLEAESARFERAYAPGNSTRLSLAPMLTGLGPQFFASIADQPAARRAALEQHWIGRMSGEEGRSALIFGTPYAWMLGEEFELGADYNRLDGATDERGHTAENFVEHVDTLVEAGFYDAAPTLTVGYIADPHPEFVCADGERGGYACYLEEVALVDRALERVYERLDEAGVLDRGLFVITADHGQAFGELHYQGHASTLAEETIRVGLLVRLPQATHRRVERPVSLMALTATTADALHAEPPAAQTHRSLLGAASGRGEPPADPVMVENWSGYHDTMPTHQTAFIDDGFKLMYDWHTTDRTLIDLGKPLEPGSDLAGEQPEVADELLERMFEWREKTLELDVAAYLR